MQTVNAQQPFGPEHLEAYLSRIGVGDAPEARPQFLFELHRAHARSIPFENFDFHLPVAVQPSLEFEHIFRKLVRRGRGGICYEQNLLLAEALRYLGFAVRYVAARNLATGTALPRTHMALVVTLGHERWLCDVGFGVAGLLNPVPFGASTANAMHRIERISENAFHLQVVTNDGWNDLYEFSTGTVTIEDLQVMHFYIARHPASRFLETPVAAIVDAERRVALRGHRLTVTAADGRSRTAFAIDHAEYRDWLVTHFGLGELGVPVTSMHLWEKVRQAAGVDAA